MYGPSRSSSVLTAGPGLTGALLCPLITPRRPPRWRGRLILRSHVPKNSTPTLLPRPYNPHSLWRCSHAVQFNDGLSARIDNRSHPCVVSRADETLFVSRIQRR